MSKYSFSMVNTRTSTDVTPKHPANMPNAPVCPQTASYTGLNVPDSEGASSGMTETGESVQVEVFDPVEVIVVRNKKRDKKCRKKKPRDERRAEYRFKKRHHYDHPNWPKARRHGSSPTASRNQKNGIRRLRQKNGGLRIACKPQNNKIK